MRKDSQLAVKCTNSGCGIKQQIEDAFHICGPCWRNIGRRVHYCSMWVEDLVATENKRLITTSPGAVLADWKRHKRSCGKPVDLRM